MLVLTSLITLAVENALPVTRVLVPCPPTAVFSPVAAVEVATLTRTPSLVVEAVMVEELLCCPATSGLVEPILSPLVTVFEAVALPVSTVPPIVEATPPVPSVEVATWVWGIEEAVSGVVVASACTIAAAGTSIPTTNKSPKMRLWSFLIVLVLGIIMLYLLFPL